MKKVFVYTFLSLIWFKYFIIIPKPIHVVPVPVRIIGVNIPNTTEESSTSSDPASNDVSGDPSSPGDSGEF